MKEKKRFIHGSIFVEKGERKNGSEKRDDKSSSLVFTSRSFLSHSSRVGKQKMIDNTNF